MNIFTFNFECQRCGACCKHVPTGIPLLIKDVERISSSLKLNTDQFIEKYCILKFYDINEVERSFFVPVLYLKTYDKVCPFYLKDNCSINSIKPYYCQSAPFISIIFQHEEIFSFYKKKCKGYGRGMLHTVENIQQQIGKEVELEKEDYEKYKNGYLLKLTKLFSKGENKWYQPQNQNQDHQQKESKFGV